MTVEKTSLYTPNNEQQQDLLQNATILLVDDMEFNLLILKEILASYGFANVELAKNGKEALEKTRDLKPDLVILDLIMPEMDGFEYCQTIRSDPDQQRLPILVQTALTVPEQRKKAFAAGATDFVAKPIDADEIIARSLVHLERQKLLDDLIVSRKRIEQELNDARQMQQVLLPTEQYLDTLYKDYGIKIEALFETSSEMGGDFWGTHPISEKELALYIIDFSGHGVTAALNTFRLHTLMQEHAMVTQDPGEYLTILNESITPLLSADQFATMFYGIINTEKNLLSYATAASTSPIIILPNEQHIIDGKGFPIGISNEATYETKHSNFTKGSSLLLYSDALIESENKEGNFLEVKEIMSILKQNKDNMFNALVNEFNTHYKHSLRDDLTINLYSL